VWFGIASRKVVLEELEYAIESSLSVTMREYLDQTNSRQFLKNYCSISLECCISERHSYVCGSKQVTASKTR
jgi:hypothetical protein